MVTKTHVSIQHLVKVFPDGTKALHDINLEIKEGEIIVLLGPSGCGKSTLLRTIGGLEEKTAGELYFYDHEVSGVPVEKRNVGFVFQNYALFPTMTVRDNVGFGLRLRKIPKAKIAKRVDELLDMMDLKPYADRKPHQLSGGQQQRVAIARVLAIEPNILLLDEPLTALDAKLKEHLRDELALMLRRLGITTIYVTHDQLEAMAIADRIAVMNKGVIEQLDTPEVIYSTPKTEFVAEFIGRINRFTGIIRNASSNPVVDLGFATLPYPERCERKREGEKVSVYLRPEDMGVVDIHDKSEHTMDAVVVQSVFMGGYCHIVARIGDQEVSFDAVNSVRPGVDDVIRIEINKDKMIIV